MAGPQDSKTRRQIAATMARLLRKQGYAATGLNQLVSESGAPKGSLYHYFPGGKEEVAAAALRFAGGLVSGTLAALSAQEATPENIVRAYGALLEGWMSKSGYSDGCPITTTMLEVAPSNKLLTAVGREAFADWGTVFARSLSDAGVAPARAQALALVAIMMIEGALVLSRVRGDPTPIRVAANEVATLFEREPRLP